MLWPKNSFGVVTWPCAFAVAVVATNARGSTAARQVRNFRIDIQNLRKVGKARSELRLASGNTRQKWRLLVLASVLPSKRRIWLVLRCECVECIEETIFLEVATESAESTESHGVGLMIEPLRGSGRGGESHFDAVHPYIPWHSADSASFRGLKVPDPQRQP